MHGEKEIFNNRDNYHLDEPNPKFNTVATLTTEFPGTSPLTVEVWDYDELWTDDLIGKTTIDLEDRFYNPKWRLLNEKPIEKRTLKHPSCR